MRSLPAGLCGPALSCRTVSGSRLFLHGNAPAAIFFFPDGCVGSLAHYAAPPSFVHFAPGSALIAARSETISRQNDESPVVALCDNGFILPNCSATSSVYSCPTIGQQQELVSLCDELPLSEFSHYATTPPFTVVFHDTLPRFRAESQNGNVPPLPHGAAT